MYSNNTYFNIMLKDNTTINFSIKNYYKNNNAYQLHLYYIAICFYFNIILYKVSLLYHIHLTILKLYLFSQ